MSCFNLFINRAVLHDPCGQIYTLGDSSGTNWCMEDKSFKKVSKFQCKFTYYDKRVSQAIILTFNLLLKSFPRAKVIPFEDGETLCLPHVSIGFLEKKRCVLFSNDQTM